MKLTQTMLLWVALAGLSGCNGEPPKPPPGASTAPVTAPEIEIPTGTPTTPGEPTDSPPTTPPADKDVPAGPAGEK